MPGRIFLRRFLLLVTAVTALLSIYSTSHEEYFSSTPLDYRQIRRVDDSFGVRRFLVTGGASFFAFHLAEVFFNDVESQRNNTDLLLVDDFQDDSLRKRYRQNMLKSKYGVSVVEADLGSRSVLEQLVLRHNAAAIIHMYDSVHVPPSAQRFATSLTVNSSRQYRSFVNVLAAVSQFRGGSVPVLYLCSPEDVTSGGTLASDAFLILKKMEKSVALRFSKTYGVKSICLRMFNVFGSACPVDDPHKRLLEQLDMNYPERKSIVFHSLDFIEVSQAAKQVEVCARLAAAGLVTSSVDIGCGQKTNLSQFARLLRPALPGKFIAEALRRVFVVNPGAVAKKKVWKPEPNSVKSEINEFVQWEDSNNRPQGILMTTYLVRRPDPQRKHVHYSERGDPALIRPFYDSIHDVGIRTYVIHDGLDDPFVRQFESMLFTFVHIKTVIPFAASRDIKAAERCRSNNDRRYFYFMWFLHSLESSKAEAKPELPRYAMYTDMFDVRMRKNPFEYFDRTLEGSLFVGLDKKALSVFKKRMVGCGVPRERVDEIEDSNTKGVNAGLAGAEYRVFREFLARMVEALRQAPSGKNCNNALFNYIAYGSYRPSMVTGVPFCSVFATYWRNKEDVYVIHKVR